MINFDLTPPKRFELRELIINTLEEIYTEKRSMSVAPQLTVEEVKKYVGQFDFDHPRTPEEEVGAVIDGLKRYAVHTPHPGYFGLFNPRTNYISVLADYITAVMNSQMAAWSHAPFANEAERLVIREFGKKFGYAPEDVDGTICGGGAESNLTAVQCAVNWKFPEVAERGVFSLEKRPVIYCSDESHHSIVKAARTVGLGSDSVKSIPVVSSLKMNLDILKNQIIKDRSDGLIPFMIVATAGTTGAGSIDPIDALSELSRETHLWLHIDGAYGGAVILSKKYNQLLKGIEKSDSVMLDFHKWFSVPMGTSVFLTRHRSILYQTFNIKTSYMPPDGDQVKMIDPYLHSIQWSRRFNGLRIFLSLAVFGWKGYEEVIDHQIDLGNRLRRMLQSSGWEIRNDAVLPVLCVTHPRLENRNDLVKTIVDRVVQSGKSWVSVYPVHGESTIRACITNYATTEEDLEILVNGLNEQLDIVMS